jgi:chromosome segregation ATPase
VAAVEAKLKPVEKEAAERKKAIETHRGQIHAMTKRIDGIERRMGAARDGAERAAAEAELAAARAEHKLMIAEEPKLVAAHAEVLPRIDALQAERTRLQRQAQATRDEHATTDIRLQATAKEAREKRDRADAARRGNEAARDAELAQLGAALDRERPPALRHRFRIVDDHAATIGSIERRILEIETAVAGVHMWAMVRGLGVVALALVLAAILAGLAFRDGV